ncbi:formyltransferase family protein, partial [uncultured Selenomonas sp.]|uniref:formyltransferase family protein n=1 Tax=uncultured Selenomonas sp. TaxID=159275 RepID=UPI0028DBB07A
MRKEVLGILCSGRGTNLDSIIKAQRAGEIRAEIAVVLTDKLEAKALERAAAAGIAHACIDRRSCATREEFEQKLVAAL